MQDSIEDFIKISSNAKSEEHVKVNQEFEITAHKRKECDMRAMKIVEFSIEGKLRPEIFTRCLSYINQNHYQDIVEERAITKLCGYSICGKKIPDMPKKQYYISTKSNKVYDITDRKNYCSNFCYKASLHIKKQIDNGPLWLRKLEDIPEYQLLESTDRGIPGEFIAQGLVQPVTEPKSFTSVSIFTEASLKEVMDKERNRERPARTRAKKTSTLLKSTMQTINENSENIEEELVCEAGNFNKTMRSIKKPIAIEHVCKNKKECSSIVKLPVIEESEEKVESKELFSAEKENSILSKENSKKIKNKDEKFLKIDVEMIIKKVVKDWLTIDTFIFLHGELKIKEVFNEKKLSDLFDQLNISELRRDQQAKYMSICKRLQLQEMADDKFDKALIGNPNLKLPPDYKKLKEETKDLNLQVRSFLGGFFHEKADANFPSKIQKIDEKHPEEEASVVLPLVDVNSQTALRRKIFLSSLNNSMQSLLRSLRVTFFTSAMSDIQLLVKTFKLKADNVVFKPMVWNYISIVLFYMLSMRDSNIKEVLDNRESVEYISFQCSALPNGNKFITDVMDIVRNIDTFVEDYISSN